jgi:solute carrier family 12 sodium/potassium/chloride transporter 2
LILIDTRIFLQHRDPSKAIPKGTLLAIGITSVSYLGYAVLIAGCGLRAASGYVKEVDVASDVNFTTGFDACDGRQCSYGLLYSQQEPHFSNFFQHVFVKMAAKNVTIFI